MKTVLAIGAHFDDVEIGCGGTIAKHVAAGDRVHILVATHSGYSGLDGQIVRDPDIAAEEGRLSASILGVDSVSCLGFETNALTADDALVVAIRSRIRELGVDSIYTHWIDDSHLDHVATARASFSAARHVPSVVSYRSNWYAGATVFNGQYLVDISTYFDTKKTAVAAHRSEMARTDGRWMDYIDSTNRAAGLRIGVRYAEEFMVVRLIG